MDIELFRAELETRLIIEKEYIVEELPSIYSYQEKLELLGKFNEKYKELIKRLANESGIDLHERFQVEDSSNSENLSYNQIILGKTMNIYDKLVDELYEEVSSKN